MAKTVRVTSAEVMAAQTHVRDLESQGKPVPDAVRKIANAKRAPARAPKAPPSAEPQTERADEILKSAIEVANSLFRPLARLRDETATKVNYVSIGGLGSLSGAARMPEAIPVRIGAESNPLRVGEVHHPVNVVAIEDERFKGEHAKILYVDEPAVAKAAPYFIGNWAVSPLHGASYPTAPRRKRFRLIAVEESIPTAD